MLNYEAWQSFTFVKWVSLSKNHVGIAIMRLINRFNIQTSWLRKNKTCAQLLNWQQDPSQLERRRFPGIWSSIAATTHVPWELFSCLQGSWRFLGNNDSFHSRSHQIPSPSFPTEVTTAANEQTVLEILILSSQFPQGREDWGTDSEKQNTQQDSLS